MLNIMSKKVRGVSMEIEMEQSRRNARYMIFADGIPVDVASTIVKAKRKANAFVGEHVFSIDAARVHA